MESTRRKLIFYFLCGQNRCRSQIAEAYARAFGNDRVVAASAGLDPSPIHPLTIQALQEDGIDISGSLSKKIDLKFFMSSHVVIRLCEDMKERCPIVPFGIRNEQWNIQDPLSDSAPSIDSVRKARDEIKEKVLKLLDQYNARL